MNSISDIKIIGVDINRPPKTSKQSYIDLFFKLSQETPEDWYDDFNKLGHKIEPPVKIDKRDSSIIETWIRDMDLIPKHLDTIKQKISLCNEEYLEKIRQKELSKATQSASSAVQDSKQDKLDLIVSQLNFDAP
jgi:hypothetical protein